MAKTSGIYKDKERGTFTVQKQYRGITIKKRGFATLNEAKAYLNNEIYMMEHPEKRENKIDATLNILFNKFIEYKETYARITTIDGSIQGLVQKSYNVLVLARYGFCISFFLHQ